MAPDRLHIHHRLIDMGFSQKQAVATLYIVSAILGLSAVVLTTSGTQKAMMFLMALCLAGAVAAWIYLGRHEKTADESTKPKSQLSGNDYFFGEEGPSDK